jgi:thymidine phosphorylase
MDQPLGYAVGNALEIREAAATLRGEGPADFTELVVAATARLLAMSDLEIDEAEGRRRAEAALGDGSAIEAYERWIRAQGGDPDENVLPEAPVVVEAESPGDGFVTSLGAIQIGTAALELGAGRRTKEDPIDYGVGIVLHKKRGDAVSAGEPLADVHARDADTAEKAKQEVLAAYELGEAPPPPRKVVLDAIV